MNQLSNDEKTRYKRQLLTGGMGEDAQKKLKASTVFIAGAGGLGSPVSLYLAAAGVGNIKICDNDDIELSNLNRQILHNTDRIGMSKAESAGKSLKSLNPSINIQSKMIFPLFTVVSMASLDRSLFWFRERLSV